MHLVSLCIASLVFFNAVTVVIILELVSDLSYVTYVLGFYEGLY